MRRMGMQKGKSARRFKGRAAKTMGLNLRNPLRGGWRL
jgi:hypothetical protein